MNHLRTALTALALVSIAGCGGTTNTPPGTDAGHDAFVATVDMGVTPGDVGPGTPDTGTDAGGGGVDSGIDGGATVDGGSDAGPCTSTMTHCNTCTTASADPFNACSSYVSGCIPFDNATRVPGWPDHIPAVTP